MFFGIPKNVNEVWSQSTGEEARETGRRRDHGKPVPCLQLKVFSVADEQPSEGLWQGMMQEMCLLDRIPWGKEAWHRKDWIQVRLEARTPSGNGTGNLNRQLDIGDGETAWTRMIFPIISIVVWLIPLCACDQSLNHIWLFVTPWTIACQCPLSMKFSRQEYWSGLPFPTPGDLLDPRIEPASFASSSLTGEFFTTMPPGKPTLFH